MKKFFSLIVSLVMFVSLFALAGCGEIVLKGGPDIMDAVTGNGSLSVRKGDYLYFVNGYVSSSSLSGKDNNYGVAKNGAIYRAKLNNGELVYETTTDEDGNEVKTLTNVELFVPKVAGFEYSDLHVFGNTLFFTSPNTEKDATGETRFDLTDVFAVSINGGKITKIANALNITSASEINYSFINSKVYVVYAKDSKLYSACVNGTKLEKTTLISENVSSYASCENNNYVYYTRSLSENEHGVSGNVLCRVDLTKNEEIIVFKDNYNTFTIKKLTDEKIFYSRTNSLTTNSYIYSLKLDNFDLNSEKQYTIVAYDNDFILSLGEGQKEGVITVYNNKLLFVKGIESLEEDIFELYDGEFTTLGVFGNTVFGKDADGNVLKIDFDDLTDVKVNTLLEADDNLYFEMSQNFDYETGYIYYYTKYTGDNSDEGYYLNRLSLTDNSTELVGKLLEKHVKTTDEEE